MPAGGASFLRDAHARVYRRGLLRRRRPRLSIRRFSAIRPAMPPSAACYGLAITLGVAAPIFGRYIDAKRR